MRTLQPGDILSKNTIRDGVEVNTTCVFTPHDPLGKDFHCVDLPLHPSTLPPSPSETETKTETDTETETTTQVTEDETSSPPSQTEADETTRPSYLHETTLFSSPSGNQGEDRQSSLDDTTLFFSPSENTTSAPPSLDGSDPPVRPFVLAPFMEGREGADSNFPFPSNTSDGQPETFFISNVSGGALPRQTMDSSEREQPEAPLCSSMDAKCRAAIEAIGTLVSRKPDTKTPPCKPLDDQCIALQSKFLSPPTSSKKVSPPLLADKCGEGTDCMSWRFLRMLAAPFLSALKGEEVKLDLFPTDSGTLFSQEGARLYRLTLSQTPEAYQVESPFMMRLVFRAQLDAILQNRLARVEMNSYLSHMLWLSIGLSLPSIILSCTYLVFHLRWAILNRREKLRAKRASRDTRLLADYQRNEAPPRNIS